MYRHLGPYSDIVTAARGDSGVGEIARPGSGTRDRLLSVLGFSHGAGVPIDPRREATWVSEDIRGEVISWSVGFGPRTSAWLLRPRKTAGERRPAVLVLHDHSDFKYFGKEKVADGPDVPDASVVEHRKTYYEGFAYANDLARRGYVVLIHDVFLWGSRRFPLDTMPERARRSGSRTVSLDTRQSVSPEIAVYDATASHHENIVEKYLSLLGTTLAGVVSYEDRIALNYLLERPEVDSARVACIGLSGGGNRAALLTATHDAPRAAVVVGLMTTYEGLLDCHVASHTWMLYPSGWARYGDWPDIAASRAPRPLLVQYNNHDELFTQAGMCDAHDRLVDHYAWAGATDAYTGEFYDGPHKFDRVMQRAAFEWLSSQLSPEDALHATPRHG